MSASPRVRTMSRSPLRPLTLASALAWCLLLPFAASAAPEGGAGGGAAPDKEASPAKAKKPGPAKGAAAKAGAEPTAAGTAAKAGAGTAAKAGAGTAAKAGAGTAAAPPADSSPMNELRQANAKLKKVLGDRKPSWSPEAEAKNTALRKIVDSFLDFDELARRALIKHWDGLKPKERTEFVKTLRALVERNYLNQMYGQPDYDLKLDNESKNGGDATVTGVLHTSARGKKVDMALEYKLVYKNGAWLVYDVITDDLSLLENYRAEFNKIIAKESFDALLSKMKKRLEDKPGD
jgi:phospholipid transport system substrate-binding protein